MPLAIVNGSLAERGHPLSSTTKQHEVLASLSVPAFDDAIAATSLGRLRATGVDVLQMNVGKLCNQTCRHCHVDAGPDRTEVMPDDVVDRCLDVLASTTIPTLDVTGGAPELHPRFEEIVARGRALGRHVMDRCNLTVLTTSKYAHLPRFFADHGVEVVASLPFPNASRTDAQRGNGVFEKSVRALRALADVGYGKDGTGLVLTLVANPVGAFLPTAQADQEAHFRRELGKEGVSFTRLFTITNMPIARYLEWLDESGNLTTYMEKLANAFNPAAAAGVMCRTTLSVAYDGTLHDCDFNQMLAMPLVDGAPRTIFDFDLDALATRPIRTAAHCYGCTAGQGSSCGGALT